MTTENKQLYVVNKLDNTLDLKRGFITLAPGAFAKLEEVDREEDTVKYAMGRSWIELTYTEPETAANGSKPEIEVVKPNDGLSEAELKELLAKKSTEEKTNPAKGVALGQDDKVVPVETEVVETTSKTKKGK